MENRGELERKENFVYAIPFPLSLFPFPANKDIPC